MHIYFEWAVGKPCITKPGKMNRHTHQIRPQRCLESIQVYSFGSAVCVCQPPRSLLGSNRVGKLAEWEVVDMPLPYAVPEIQDNPDGWGPCNEPEHLKDVPFAPFSKGDKLGKAADWTQQAYQKYPGAFDAPTC